MPHRQLLEFCPSIVQVSVHRLENGIPNTLRYQRSHTRLTRGQKRSLCAGGSHLILNADLELRTADLFARKAPLVLDVGSGMGDSVLQLAAAHPENTYLAVDFFPPGVGSLLRRAMRDNLGNLFIAACSVHELLAQLPKSRISQAFIAFPDPWPKRRHHKRRLVNHSFLMQLAPHMATPGRVLLLSDCANYAASMLQDLTACAGYTNLAANSSSFSPVPTWYPRSKYHNKATNAKRDVWCLHFACC